MDMLAERQQPRWRTYCVAFLFLIPALCAWAFTATFLLPKSHMLWAESGIVGNNSLINIVNFFGHQSFVYLKWVVLSLIVTSVVLEFFTKFTPRRRRYLTGAVVFGMNAMVFVGLISLVISLTIVTPVIHRKANFLAQYSHAAGVLPVAEQQWDSRNVAFKLGVEDLSTSEWDQVDVLLGVLEGGATDGVCRGAVGSLLRHESLLRERPVWGERFLNRVSHLSDQDLESMDEAVAWYQSVASEPEWQATL